RRPSGPAYGASAHGGLRIGDRERDEVTRLLHDAFAQGRITREELDERLDATLSARTAEDLRRVTADLPGGWPDDASDGGRRAGDARAGGPWRPGFPSPGMPGFPGSPVGMRPGPYGPYGPHRPGGPHWAYGNWGYGMVPRRRGHRPHPALFLIPVAAIVVLAAGPMWPPFLVLKFLLVALVVKAVLGLAHHRRHHRHWHPGLAKRNST
ncbi:DUF1707 domain-containing protein, partial [Microbispora sp. GKU 823]|uniref:DUF1707 SHOCT-like domain-containing protein n=1 Tax=Microbispora sp. GKU 823 TaxID=1652100 RepID=UPI0009CF7956